MANEKSSFELHLEKLKGEYKAQIPAKIAAIKSDWEALFANWQPDTMVILHRNVHSLIGTSGTFGFTDISKTARELETFLKPLLEKKDSSFQPDEKLHYEINRLIENIGALIEPSPSSTIATPIESTAPVQPIAESKSVETVEALEATEATEERITPSEVAISQHTQQLSDNRQSATVAKNILIYYLDDEIAAPELLTQSLISYGFRSKHFRTMTQLLEGIQAAKPSLVILDLIMPNIATAKVFDLAKSIVKLDVKVFMLSGHDTFESRLEAVRAGIHAFIAKPADVPALVGQIRHVLNLNSEKPSQVLIVDDQESVAQFYATVLNQAGIQVTIETNPADVLTVLKNKNPDLIILDLNMPDVNGPELAAIIRQFMQYQSIPILFLSAEAHPDKKTSLLEIGSDDLLAKGMATEEFIRQVKSRIERSKILTSIMYQDSLTGLLNHAQIQLAAERVFQHSVRRKSTFSIAMIDIDKFKFVNDTYGHLTGDRVIKALAQLFEQRLRSTDYIGRFGGEEFMLVLPDININDAGNLVNNLRKAFSAIKFEEENISFSVSFSAGLAENTGMENFIEQLKFADEALYKAKNRGRNLVCASLSGDSQ